jgi:hypothetical protein
MPKDFFDNGGDWMHDGEMNPDGKRLCDDCKNFFANTYGEYIRKGYAILDIHKWVISEAEKTATDFKFQEESQKAWFKKMAEQEEHDKKEYIRLKKKFGTLNGS